MQRKSLSTYEGSCQDLIVIPIHGIEMGPALFETVFAIPSPPSNPRKTSLEWDPDGTLGWGIANTARHHDRRSLWANEREEIRSAIYLLTSKVRRCYHLSASFGCVLGTSEPPHSTKTKKLMDTECRSSTSQWERGRYRIKWARHLASTITIKWRWGIGWFLSHEDSAYGFLKDRRIAQCCLTSKSYLPQTMIDPATIGCTSDENIVRWDSQWIWNPRIIQIRSAVSNTRRGTERPVWARPILTRIAPHYRTSLIYTPRTTTPRLKIETPLYGKSAFPSCPHQL